MENIMIESVASLRPTLIGVIGHQRGGTTGFRQFFGSGNSAIDLGEIFSGHVKDFTNFFRFLRSSSECNPEWMCPHFWYNAWEAYIAEMARVLNFGNLIFDLKLDVFPFVYRHEAYSQPHASGFFFSWNKVKLIHLERRNALAQVVSRVKAARSGNWGLSASDLPEEQYFRMHVRERGYDPEVLDRFGHLVPDWVKEALRRGGHDPRLMAQSEVALLERAVHSGGAPSPDIENAVNAPIDPAWLLREVECVLESNRFAWEASLPLNPLKVYYEDFYTEDCTINPAEIERVCAFTGLDPDTLSDRPLSQKLAPRNFLSPFANATDIAAHFASTEHAWMVPQAD